MEVSDDNIHPCNIDLRGCQMYHCKIRSINTKYLLVFRPPCAFVILLNCFKNQGWSGLFHFVTKALLDVREKE